MEAWQLLGGTDRQTPLSPRAGAAQQKLARGCTSTSGTGSLVQRASARACSSFLYKENSTYVVRALKIYGSKL